MPTHRTSAGRPGPRAPQGSAPTVREIAERSARLAAKASLAPLESVEQQALALWALHESRRRPELELLFAVPNGGWRAPKTAAKLKAEGAKPGVPDLVLPVARGGYFGLFVEMKRVAHGTASASQRAWHARLGAEGYRVELCRGAEAAQAAILAYLALPATAGRAA